MNFENKYKVFQNWDSNQKKENYGSAPIIFMDEEKRKEWEEMDPQLKEFTKKHLHRCCQESTTKISIELLCHVYNDLSERLDKLEKEHE